MTLLYLNIDSVILKQIIFVKIVCNKVYSRLHDCINNCMCTSTCLGSAIAFLFADWETAILQMVMHNDTHICTPIIYLLHLLSTPLSTGSSFPVLIIVVFCDLHLMPGNIEGLILIRKEMIVGCPVLLFLAILLFRERILWESPYRRSYKNGTIIPIIERSLFFYFFIKSGLDGWMETWVTIEGI